MFGWLVEERMLTKLPICEAQEILKPECTEVHEDFKILKQRSRWVNFRSNINYRQTLLIEQSPEPRYHCLEFQE